jgi:tRNA threonylcarbamoyl adenosine modification protein YeaZ
VLALGIDTSTPTVSVALVDNERVLDRRDLLVDNGHGEVLAMLVGAVLRAAGVAAADLSTIGVGLGPGPFTGLRVGIVTAAAMSDALNVAAYGQCSLDVVGAEHVLDGRPFAVVTDARRRQTYWAVYGEAGERVEGPDIAPPGDVADRLRGRVRDVVGPGAAQYAAAFADFDVAAARWPDAARLAQAAIRSLASREAVKPLLPMYLRRPDAREPGPPKPVTPP